MTLASRDEAVETIRQRIDLLELVGRYVKLKKAGSNFVGLCPFHAEKTPSFSVSPRKGFFHCFGCKASGDIFTFLMRMEGKTFPEALDDLAHQAGVDLPRRPSADPKRRELNERLLQINEVAAAYYQQQLRSPSAGHSARSYLAQRRLSDATLAKFRIGFAPGGWHGLADHLRQKGQSLQEAQSLGLLAAGGSGPYDVFRNRLVFPIVGLGGKVAGFGARKIDEGEEGPKYINSRQSRVFDKSEILYGLQQARKPIQASGEVALVEGYFDVLSAVEAGLENVVATCGTALTERHTQLIRRFAEKVTTIFDADEAGLSASYRSASLLLREDLAAYMVTLPPGEDPDSLVRSQGKAALESLLREARPTIEVLAERGVNEGGDDVEARTAALRKLVPILAACQDSIRLGNYVRLVADRFGMDEGDLRQAIRRARQKERPFPANPPSPPAPSGDLQADRVSLHPEEETCLVLLLKFPHLGEHLRENAVASKLESPGARDLLQALLQAEATGSLVAMLDLVGDAEVRDRLAGKAIDDGAYPEEKADSLMEECVVRIRRRHVRNELRRLTKRIGQAEKDGRTEERKELQRSKMRLDRELASLEFSMGKPL